ncbi:uncharacterized protein LOC144448967 [Glandiceps talaboti]
MVKFLIRPLTLGSTASPERRRRMTDGSISAVLLAFLMMSIGISLTICQLFKLQRSVYPSIGTVLPIITIVTVLLSMLTLVIIVLKRGYWVYNKEELDRGIRQRSGTEVNFRDPVRARLLPLCCALIGLGCISFHLVGAYHHFHYHFYYAYSAEITFKIFYCLQVPFTVLLVIFIYVYSTTVLKNRLSLRYIIILLACTVIFSYLTVFVDKYSSLDANSIDASQNLTKFPNNVEIFLVLFAMQFLILVASFLYECWARMGDPPLRRDTSLRRETDQSRRRSSKAKRKLFIDHERKHLLGNTDDSSDTGGGGGGGVSGVSTDKTFERSKDKKTVHIPGSYTYTPNATQVKATVERTDRPGHAHGSPKSVGTDYEIVSPYTTLEANQNPEYTEYFYPKPRLTPCDDNIYEDVEEEIEHTTFSADDDETNVYEVVFNPTTGTMAKHSGQKIARKEAFKRKREQNYGTLHNSYEEETVCHHSRCEQLCLNSLKITGIIVGFLFSISMLIFAIILTSQCQTNVVHDVTCLGRHFNTTCDISVVRTYIYAYYSCKTVLFILVIICCWVFFHIFGKDSDGYNISKLHPQDIFLLISAFGVFLHQSFCAFSAISNIGADNGNQCFMEGLPSLILAETVLSIIVTYLQTTLLISNFACDKHQRHRSMVLVAILTTLLTFIVISNTAMWLLHSFFTVSPYFCLSTMQKIFYGEIGWFVISSLTLPSVLYFHLQSILTSFGLIFQYRKYTYQQN